LVRLLAMRPPLLSLATDVMVGSPTVSCLPGIGGGLSKLDRFLPGWREAAQPTCALRKGHPAIRLCLPGQSVEAPVAQPLRSCSHVGGSVSSVGVLRSRGSAPPGR
jgi:hypothetical protein